jgi:hypothetical protein
LATRDLDSAKVTFKNLEVLTSFMRHPDMLYNGEPRSIILSEQGFHTPDGPKGEAIQAAAYCYAYKKIEALEDIDAFILHRHVDHPNEGGLRLGLRYRDDNRSKKLIYECFRRADQPDWEEAFRFALPLTGLSNWGDALSPPLR